MEIAGAISDSGVLSEAIIGVLLSIAVSAGIRLSHKSQYGKAALMVGVAILFCGLYEWWQVRISRPITQGYYKLDEYRLGGSLDEKY